MELKERMRRTLKIESGSNDPMAVFLTVTLVELLAANRTCLDAGIFVALAKPMGIGAARSSYPAAAPARLAAQPPEPGRRLYPLLAMAGKGCRSSSGSRRCSAAAACWRSA